jgi:IclR family transcriptional regulator, acetate operon repressor
MSPTKLSTSPAPKGQRNEMRLIARAAEILRALAASQSHLSLGQLSKATGLPRSSVQRLVGALEVEGFISSEAGQVGVTLGIEILRLGASVQSSLRERFRPHLQALQLNTNDTIDLTLLMDGTPIVVDQISSTSALRVVSFIGRPLPLATTASGRAHMASENRINDFFYDHEDYEEGVCAIAMTLRTLKNENYAVAISMPAKRFKERLPFLRERLSHCHRNLRHVAGLD